MNTTGRRATTALGRRIQAAGLTMADVAWLTRIPVNRIRDGAQEKITLRSDELDRIDQVCKSHRVVYSRRLEPKDAPDCAAEGVVIKP